MLIKEMVEIYSPTGSEDELVDFLVQWGNENGFLAFRDEVGNFVAQKGSGRKILMVGHVDTAPGRIDVKLEGNRLYGRGAVDAKGPLACFLEAARDVDRSSITIVGSVDEEGESRGAKHILKKYNPEYIIIGEPSGWSNLNMGYKGRLNLFYKNERAKEHRSALTHNCNEECIDFLGDLRDFRDSLNRGKSLFESLGMKPITINSKDNGFSECIEMSINFMVPLGFDLNVLKGFVNERKGCATINYSSFEKPIKVGKQNRLISVFIRAIRSTGGEVKFKLRSGASDMNILQEYNAPMVTYGPGDFRLEHTVDEYIDMDEYEKANGIMKKVLEGL